MKLRQKAVVDRLLEQCPWSNGRQITISMAYFVPKTKLRCKIARNFYTMLEIKEGRNSKFKEIHERSREPLKDKVKKCMSNNYADQICIKNRIFIII